MEQVIIGFYGAGYYRKVHGAGYNRVGYGTDCYRAGYVAGCYRSGYGVGHNWVSYGAAYYREGYEGGCYQVGSGVDYCTRNAIMLSTVAVRGATLPTSGVSVISTGLRRAGAKGRCAALPVAPPGGTS